MGVKKQVFRLDVAVRDALRVKVAYARKYLFEAALDLAGRRYVSGGARDNSERWSECGLGRDSDEGTRS
jgi:hypothetical protein